MFKKTRKTLALVLALSMIMVLFAGIAQASGALAISSTVRLVRPDANQQIGTIRIAGTNDTPAAGTNTVVTLTLPEGVTWDDTDVVTSTVTVMNGVTTTSAGERVDSRTARFTFATTTVSSTVFTIQPIVDVSDTFRGDVRIGVEISSQNAAGTEINWVQTATVTAARVFAAVTVTTARDVTNIGRGIGNQLAGSIRIVEGMAATINGNSVIRITLPAGVTFAAYPSFTNPGFPRIGINAVARDRGTLTATTTATSSAASTIDFTNIRLNVDPTVPDGPIIATISGANVKPASVTIANVGVVGAVAISSVTAPADLATRDAGRLNQAVSHIRLTESTPGIFLGNRVLTLTLPVGFTWNTTTAAWASSPVASEGGRILTFWTNDPPASSGTIAGNRHFDITGITINTNITAPAGDIVVTVGGTTGATGTVTVARLRRQITVTAVAATNVRVDATGQALGNLVITETVAGALRAGTTTITLPEGTTFVGTPSVSVADVAGTEPSVAIATAANVITLTVTAPPIAATTSTIVTVSGIRVNLDRTRRILAGDTITARVAGPAILDAGAEAGTLPEVVLGTVISATARRTVFTIDATASTVDGVAQPLLDVAPFIQDGRTMMPLRAAANAAGVTNDNILFDAGVITVIRGDRIAQFTLGSRVMVVNGVAMNMDVAPALVQGRALVPVRWVATALGVPVLWDDVTRTITVTVQ